MTTTPRPRPWTNRGRQLGLLESCREHATPPSLVKWIHDPRRVIKRYPFAINKSRSVSKFDAAKPWQVRKGVKLSKPPNTRPVSLLKILPKGDCRPITGLEFSPSRPASVATVRPAGPTTQHWLSTRQFSGTLRAENVTARVPSVLRRRAFSREISPRQHTRLRPLRVLRAVPDHFHHCATSRGADPGGWIVEDSVFT
jgi:hypothetical protein